MLAPNKHAAAVEALWRGHLLDSETYIGGKVPALECIFCLHVPCKQFQFRLLCAPAVQIDPEPNNPITSLVTAALEIYCLAPSCRWRLSSQASSAPTCPPDSSCSPPPTRCLQPHPPLLRDAPCIGCTADARRRLFSHLLPSPPGIPESTVDREAVLAL